MENLLIERIRKIVSAKEKSVRKFASAIGFNYTTLNNYLTGIRKTIDSELLVKIITTYEDISAEWLLAGKGDMYTEKKSPPSSGELVNYLENKLDNKENDIAKLNIEIARLNKEIGMLNGLISQEKLLELKGEL